MFNPLLVAVLLVVSALSIVFAVLAFYSPVKSLPVVPLCFMANNNYTDPTALPYCYAQVSHYVNVYVASMPGYESYLTYGSIAAAFVVVALLLAVAPKLKVPHQLERKISLPYHLILVSLLLLVVGLAVFLFYEGHNIAFASTGNWNYRYVFYATPQPVLVTILGLTVASLSFGALRSSRGVANGIKSGVLFGAFWVVIAQSCLCVFDYKEMWMHVTDFAANWTLFNIPILSNWFVLIVSWSVLVVGTLSVYQGRRV